MWWLLELNFTQVQYWMFILVVVPLDKASNLQNHSSIHIIIHISLPYHIHKPYNHTQ